MRSIKELMLNKPEQFRQLTNDGGWVGIDFDGVLVEYDGWKGPEHVGAPIPCMIRLVKELLACQIKVRIFTSRVGPIYPDQIEINKATISQFCEKHFATRLEITCCKDQHCVVYLDDRAVQMVPNKGITVTEQIYQRIKEALAKFGYE